MFRYPFGSESGREQEQNGTDDLAHVSLYDYINMTDVSLHGAAGTNKLSGTANALARGGQ